MLKKISTKYLSIAKTNLEQGTIKIKHINRIHATNNHNILTNGKEKNKLKNITKYLLYEHAL